MKLDAEERKLFQKTGQKPIEPKETISHINSESAYYKKHKHKGYVEYKPENSFRKMMRREYYNSEVRHIPPESHEGKEIAANLEKRLAGRRVMSDSEYLRFMRNVEFANRLMKSRMGQEEYYDQTN